MKEIKLGLRLLFFLGFLSCAPYYLSNRFTEQSRDHQVIAILPFEMQFTGVMPKELSEEMLSYLEEGESRAFQISFYNELRYHYRKRRKALRVEIQDYDRTLNLLAKNNIDIRQSWSMLPEELANVLNVDAVVRARIQKSRFMSDLASFGVDLGTEIISTLVRIPWRSWLGNVSNQTNLIQADYTLFDQQAGTTLWSMNFEQGTDWTKPANQLISEISHRAAQKFPYRK